MSSATKAIFALTSMEQLREAQNAINVRVREIQIRAAHSFSVGDKVSFKSRYGETITGNIIKINQKTVKVKTATTIWNVTGSLLNKA